jgi:hypothetical protein
MSTLTDILKADAVSGSDQIYRSAFLAGEPAIPLHIDEHLQCPANE